MLYRFIYPILLIILCCGSCSPQDTNNSKAIIKANKEYVLAKSYFKNNFLEHFPDSIKKLPTQLIVDTNAISDHPRIILYDWRNSDVIDSLTNIYSSQAIKVYDAEDTCLLVVNRFTNENNWHLRNKYKYVDNGKISRNCYSDKLPIPNFWDSPYVAHDTEMRLPKDFKVYVLEAKSGKYWDDKHLTTGKYMPEGWKNGYSKGVAISKDKKVAVYWFIIW